MVLSFTHSNVSLLYFVVVVVVVVFALFCQTGFLFFSNKFSHSALMFLQLCLFLSFTYKRHTGRKRDRMMSYIVVRLIAFFFDENFLKTLISNDNNLFIFLHYREVYPRVLECILQTESSEMILSNKDEILETLNIVATDSGMSL